ncbi:threonine dehydratase [Candidatus Roizmanbacteria bacterium CG_4_9_14_0_2_um_filter_39_13]|uniref:L-threonine dehydratase n=2 Tax=Candidatus Roizmaniibacteriota TaxID=1752723 RepID=A0A2M8EWP9_9BACT|nr:MAG: threonine dehydratase [Candidatus Roizmanbacteria bacterium CG_4_10_14_0_2_um_filter_39_12]PJC30304.1 MAG: threonine dehydratase [Candidatus Roizmanbacteria bacterium CG_4_9_14_0_2_um_filter_39_13]PJE62178.1 MAG: threonine dehydratase [Candidatus Roizmanbacteria bacterium CG10_big_fil_rev_8_21_14_0_10_39_12]
MSVTKKNIESAALRLSGVAKKTPLQKSARLSKKYDATIYLKREDLQEVRSFKIRGAYNKMSSLSKAEKQKGIVCASAGNHAQGVAWSCNALKIHGTIFMPTVTPNQKIDKVKQFGDGFVEIKLVGSTFDDASIASRIFEKKTGAIYVHPFNDPLTIAGQGTVGKEIVDQVGEKIAYVFACIGGGGLISGVSTFLKNVNEDIKVIGVEPEGASCMHESLKQNKIITLKKIDTFVDGAAVATPGDLTFEIVKKNVDDVLRVPEGKDCITMIELYQNEGIVAEPAGALSVAALDDMAEQIKGKTVVCILSGGNNDILRYPEIMEKSLVYQGRKHYFLIEFAQKPGQLKRMLDEALGPNDDIVRFEYMKKTNKEKAPALVGFELRSKEDLKPLMNRMDAIELKYTKLSEKDMLYQYLV